MQPTRRELLAGAGTGLAAGLAGCAGELTTDGAALGALEVSLSASAQSETGYAHYRTETMQVVEEFQRFGFSRSVEVDNVVSEYDRAIDLGILGARLQAAVFATLSTPQVRILGRSFNPVADMSPLEIAELLQEHYDQIEGVREDRSFEAPVAGSTTTVTRFRARARLVEIDQGVDVYLYVSRAVEVDDDFVVTLAVHPQVFGAAEETVRTLVAGVERQ